MRPCDALAQRGQSRAASIFARHLGDLLRDVSSDKSMKQAEFWLSKAINLAFAGGHEDIRRLALLSRIKWQIRREPPLQDIAAMHKELDTIEQYARVLGMPRLSTEVAELRARIYLQAGDVKMAGTMATQGVEIASRNELRIRKINLLLLLAEINVRRNQENAAEPLLHEAASVARDAECHYVRARNPGCYEFNTINQKIDARPCFSITVVGLFVGLSHIHVAENLRILRPPLGGPRATSEDVDRLGTRHGRD